MIGLVAIGIRHEFASPGTGGVQTRSGKSSLLVHIERDLRGIEKRTARDMWHRSGNG